jgi:hypothetical protein
LCRVKYVVADDSGSEDSYAIHAVLKAAALELRYKESAEAALGALA